MRKRQTSTSKVIREMIAAGKYRSLEVMAPLPRTEGWECTDVVHQNERAIAERLKPSEVAEDRTIVLMNRAEQKLGLFALSDEPHDASAAKRDARQRAEILQALTKVIPAMQAGRITTLEQFARLLPKDTPMGLALALMDQARKHPIEVETAKGAILLNAADIAVKALHSEAAYVVEPIVWGIDDFCKPHGGINFEANPEDFDDGVRELISPRGLTSAVLKTDSDERTRAMLHYARFASISVIFELKIEYVFGTGRRFTVTALRNEADILAGDAAPGEVFKDRYVAH